MTATAPLGFVSGLAHFGDRLALVGPDGGVDYRELDRRVGEVAERLGSVRRLVLLSARNDVDTIVAYLAALRGGHPVLLADASQIPGLVAAYDPDVVVDGGLAERRRGTAHELHPELALLLSTSGSTGSPKLVRLSSAGLRANAEAIAEYLDIRPTDRAITSLPLHYCYGLSVLNSNLSRGACVVLTDRSVVDAEFWAAVREHRVTSLHGVPHTFELLDRVRFEAMELPDLRYLTQAGGKLGPEQVRRYAALGEERGWRLFVMYGQTEATARMAYLPPELARTHPSAIGVPIPGGDFTIDDGELVYRGPNVMLGYATAPADLALGREVTELRTGDLARRTADGLYEVVGRKSRFVKPFGLRVDLDRVERVLAEAGLPAACAGDDDALVVAVTGSAKRAGRVVRERFGLPAGSVRVHRVDRFPRLPNGKLDYRAVARLGSADRPAASVRAVFQRVLGRESIPEDATFVGLGGDSLCYVQMSVALERLVGALPERWPRMTVAELEALRRPPRRLPRVETDIVLRAVAIVTVVASHVGISGVLGGAHLLLAVAGWNFARFLLPGTGARIARSAALVAVPALAWLVFRWFAADDVTVIHLLFVDNFVYTGAIGYWFVEVLLHALLALAVVFSIPAVRRWERAHGFAFALAALGVAYMLRLAFLDGQAFFDNNLTTVGAVWFFPLGWLAFRARTPAQKGFVLGVALVLVTGNFGDLPREAFILAGLALLLAVRRVPVPRPLVGVLSLVACSSLYIYLTHYAVFPSLVPHLPAGLVVAVCVAVGVLSWTAVGRSRRMAGRASVGHDGSGSADEERTARDAAAR